jgi:hypothetical protein
LLGVAECIISVLDGIKEKPEFPVDVIEISDYSADLKQGADD